MDVWKVGGGGHKYLKTKGWVEREKKGNQEEENKKELRSTDSRRAYKPSKSILRKLNYPKKNRVTLINRIPSDRYKQSSTKVFEIEFSHLY